MSIESDDFAAPIAAIPRPAERKISSWTVFTWSVRREIWENKSVYIAPSVVALLLLLAVSIGISHVPIGHNFDLGEDPAPIMGPLSSLAGPILFTSFIIAFFYCLDALYGEKKDRSILFWKSLPVSDLVAVAAKATMPMVVLPVITLIAAMVLQAVVLIVGTMLLMARGVDVKALLLNFPLLQFWGEQIARVIVLVLWYAPIYGWLFLVSACARRAPFVWAVMIPVGALILEKIAFGTMYVGSLLQQRLFGGLHLVQVSQSDNTKIMGVAPTADVMDLLTRPGMLIGLMVALAVMAVVVYLRRSREPI